MTAYAVDVTELRRAVADLGAIQRDLIGLAGELDRAHERLHEDWSGLASAAQASAYASWRDGCADMVTALAALRGIVADADACYSRAVEVTIAPGRQVSV